MRKPSPDPIVSRKKPARSGRQRKSHDLFAQASTRDRILIAAAHLFATSGFAHTSMPVIAKRSGITPGAIYRHFDSKAQLLVEVVRYALERLPTSVRVLEPAKIDATQLPEFAASYVTPGYKLMRQLSLEIHSAANREQGAKKLLSKVNEEAAQAISASIAAAQRSGTFNRELDPDFAARFLQVIIMGLAHMETLLPDLIGNPAWHDFVLKRVSALLDFHPAGTKSVPKSDLHPYRGGELESD